MVPHGLVLRGPQRPVRLFTLMGWRLGALKEAVLAEIISISKQGTNIGYPVLKRTIKIAIGPVGEKF